MNLSFLDLRRKPRKLLEALKRRENITLSRRGEEIARIVPLEAPGETVTLTTAQMPSHSHDLKARDAGGDSSQPESHAIAKDGAAWTADFNTNPPDAAMHSSSIPNVGGGQGHNNLQPYLVVNFVIALQGLFPARN